jgi:hypothetical protein
MQIIWGACNCPTFYYPVIEDLVGWFEDGFIVSSLLRVTLNPMVFFDDTGLTDACEGTPKIVLEVQGSSSNGTGVLQRVAKS